MSGRVDVQVRGKASGQKHVDELQGETNGHHPVSSNPDACAVLAPKFGDSACRWLGRFCIYELQPTVAVADFVVARRSVGSVRNGTDAMRSGQDQNADVDQSQSKELGCSRAFTQQLKFS